VERASADDLCEALRAPPVTCTLGSVDVDPGQHRKPERIARAVYENSAEMFVIEAEQFGIPIESLVM
jgi:hypothetical protein